MDFEKTAENFGDKMTFLVGVDVQNTLPNGSVEDVVQEIKYIYDTFYTPKGGLLLAAGNGIMGDTPLENIEAMLKTMAQL